MGQQKVAQLYDHGSDPHDYVNLIDNPRHAGVKSEMRRHLDTGWKPAGPNP